MNVRLRAFFAGNRRRRSGLWHRGVGPRAVPASPLGLCGAGPGDSKADAREPRDPGHRASRHGGYPGSGRLPGSRNARDLRAPGLSGPAFASAGPRRCRRAGGYRHPGRVLRAVRGPGSHGNNHPRRPLRRRHGFGPAAKRLWIAGFRNPPRRGPGSRPRRPWRVSAPGRPIRKVVSPWAGRTFSFSVAARRRPAWQQSGLAGCSPVVGRPERRLHPSL